MGQHKHNPTAIAAKNGELKTKEKERHMTDSEFMEFIEDTIIKHTGLTTGEDAAIMRAVAEINSHAKKT